MAQSRVQKGKSKKPKLPMLWLGIIVVLVVVVAGYAIIRFSKASPVVVGYYVKSASNKELNGGVSYQYKQTSGISVREVGNVPVYAEYTYDQVMGSTTTGPQMNVACIRSYILNNTAYTIRIESAGVFGIPVSTGPSQFRSSTRDWSTNCVSITTSFKTGLKNLYAIYGTKPKVRVYISEDSPNDGYVGVDKIWLTTN